MAEKMSLKVKIRVSPCPRKAEYYFWLPALLNGHYCCARCKNDLTILALRLDEKFEITKDDSGFNCELKDVKNASEN